MNEMPSHSDVVSRLSTVNQTIATACREARREVAAVTLIAVSKTFGVELIEPVIAAGQRVFGEPGARGAGQVADSDGTTS